MAVDTVQKRASVARLVYPTGSIGQATRQAVSEVYAGIEAGLGIITTPLVIFTAPARPMAVVATIDVLTWTAPARPMAVVSSARGAT